MSEIMDQNLYRCWSLSKDPDKELENIKNQRLYFNLASNFKSDGEFELIGAIPPETIALSLAKELIEMQKARYNEFYELTKKLRLTCGVPNLELDDNFIEKISGAFSRMFLEQINRLKAKSADAELQESIIKNIGMICFSNTSPSQDLLEDKGVLNGWAICCVYDRDKIIKSALEQSNVFVIPKVVYSSILPSVEHIFYRCDKLSEDNFCKLIITAGSRIREEYSYENEFRILRVIGDGTNFSTKNQLLVSKSSLKRILASKKEPIGSKAKSELRKLQRIAQWLNVRIEYVL
jgi:hypothetical protein